MARRNVPTTVYEEIGMELSGARILVDSLKREGVEYIFGVNGGRGNADFRCPVRRNRSKFDSDAA